MIHVPEQHARIFQQAQAAAVTDQESELFNDDIGGQIDLLLAAQDQAKAATERANSLEQELHQAREQVRCCEMELAAKIARIGELLRQVELLQNLLEHGARVTQGPELQVPTSVPPGGTPPVAVAAAAAEQASLEFALIDDKPPASTDAPKPGVKGPMLLRMDGKNEVAHPLGPKCTIGRAPDNDIQIISNGVSRHHAVLLTSPHFTLVEDLGSTNGVIVNGEKVNVCTLGDGDVIKIGRTKFRCVSRPTKDLPAPTYTVYP